MSADSTSQSPSNCNLAGTHEIYLPVVTNEKGVTNGKALYVATNGSPSGDGSEQQPWDLASALSGEQTVPPGTTIFVRGGVYTGEFTSRLAGGANAPITVRAYQDERPVIDGNLNLKGQYGVYVGFEVTNTNLNAERLNGIMVFGPHIDIVNFIVHDSTGSGIGTWSQAPDSEVYGSIIYNNGRDAFNHGIYVQNASGIKNITDNIIFNQSGYGIHGYGVVGEELRGFFIEGNIIFNNGMTLSDGFIPDILVGGEGPAEAISIVNNYTYQSRSRSPASNYWSVDLGYKNSPNKDLVVKDNYFVGVGFASHVARWEKLTMTGNTFYGTTDLVELVLPSSASASTYEWNNNTYYNDQGKTPFSIQDTTDTFAQWQQATGFDRNSTYMRSRPTATKVFVRRNKYEAGRANIVIYNWERLDTVEVDVSGVLSPGDQYVVRNAQNYQGPPTLTGIYDGSPLRLPMTAVSPSNALHYDSAATPVTGPEFNAFVLTSKKVASQKSAITCTPISPTAENP